MEKTVWEDKLGKEIEIQNVDQGYEYMDKIPDFQYSLRDIYVANDQEWKGYIPKLGHWFWPLDNNGNISETKIYNEITSTRRFKEWAPAKIIDKDRLEWREKYHSVPYILDDEIKRMMDEWYSKGEFEDIESRMRVQNIDANLVRLLSHDNAPACRDFAILVLKFAANHTKEELFNVFPVIGGDGDDGGQFWTFGPYILEALKVSRMEEGVESDDYQDFLKVLLWMQSRKKTGDWGYDALYPGVGGLRREIHELYLPRNGFHGVHKYVGKVGEHIAKYLKEIVVSERVVLENERIRKLDNPK